MLKKSKLLLAIMPFMLASCGSHQDCLVSRDSYVLTTVNSGATNYNVMCYNIGVVDGKSISVKKDIFKAEHSGKTYSPVCLLNTCTYKTTEGGWIYDKIIDSKVIPSSSETSSTTSVYVAFESSSEVTTSSNFYCKDTLITTKSVIINI